MHAGTLSAAVRPRLRRRDSASREPRDSGANAARRGGRGWTERRGGGDAAAMARRIVRIG